MKKHKNIEGITLMALAITIVILLILTGITIMTFSDDGGIVEQTKKTQNEMENLQNSTIQQIQNLANELANTTGDTVIVNP